MAHGKTKGGKLKKGFRYAKGGRVVAVKKKKGKKRRRKS